ncbi:MAG: hypothetical protein ACRDPH_16760 [Marmoricola sp.]
MAIEEGGVSGAVATAMLAVTNELRLFGGGVTYAGSQLEASAAAYDASDRLAHSGLMGLFGGSPDA